MENTKELYDIIHKINAPKKKKKLPLNKIFDLSKKKTKKCPRGKKVCKCHLKKK